MMPLTAPSCASAPPPAETTLALKRVPAAQREGMQFLIQNMPDADRHTLSAQFLLQNVALAYEAWQKSPWKASIPKSVFLNAVLPYASLTETRDDWREMLREKALPLITGCRTPGEAAQRLNEKLFPLLNVHYSTERSRPDQSPCESLASGKASCSGLSILLVDACRSVGIPARIAGTPMWMNGRGNHTWVEVWDGGWHFVGASEPDAQGLDHAWFTHDASEAIASDPAHAIYASSFQKTGLAFPLVWATDNQSVPAVNVTARYAPQAAAAKTTYTARLLVNVLDSHGKRVAANVTVHESGGAVIGNGISKDETADLNNLLTFDVHRGETLEIAAARGDQTARQSVSMGTDTPQIVEMRLESSLSAAAHKTLMTALTAYFSASPEKQAQWTFPATLEKLLQKNDSAVREAAWKAYRNAPIHAAAKQDFDAKQVRFGTYLSPYTVKTVGTRPAHGWGLVIAMHGGGGAPKEVNDEQWQEMQIYYKDHPENGGYLYLALRAPNDTWNGFYDVYVYPLIANLVRQFLLLGDVDPNKVFLIGYSHGGYGAFAIGPKEPDLFAAIHASASAPTDGETTAKTLRTTPFTVMVGDHDTMYGRLERDQKFAAEVQALRGHRTDIYPVTVDIKAGFGHGGLPDRDFLAQMTPAVRNPVPREVTWLMTDDVITDCFWLQTKTPGKTQEIDAACRDNHLVVTTTPNVTSATVLLDSRLVDFARPLTLEINGKTSQTRIVPSLRTLCETLRQRGDPNLAFTARLDLPR